MPTSKKLSLIFLFSILLLSVSVSFVLARELEVQYPGTGAPTTTRPILSDYVRYIFNFAIGIAGLIVFGVIVFSGVQVIINAQNPAALGEAKSRIMDAIIGLIVILGSYILLTTINPQLIIINPTLGKADTGITLTDSKGQSITYKVSQSDLGDFQPVSYLFVSKADDLEVTSYPNTGLQGTGAPLAAPSGTFPTGSKSIQLNYKYAGAYLCKDTSGKKDCFYTSSSVSDLGKDYEDKITSVEFKNNDSVKYGAVLHEGKNYTLTCKDYLQDGTIPPNTGNGVFPGGGKEGVSSVTVFLQGNASDCTGVTLYDATDYQGNSINIAPPGQTDLRSVNFDEKSRSIRVNGNCLVILFRDTDSHGVCEVLPPGDDPDLTNNAVTCAPGWPIDFHCLNTIDTVSSLKIIPKK